MECRCGGNMLHKHPARETAMKMLQKHRPWSRNRRIMKKQMKRFARTSTAQLAMHMTLLSGPGIFVCEKCGKKDSFYSAIGRNIIKVEPMPGPAAMPVYEKS